MFDIEPVTTNHHTACGPACLKMLLAFYGIEVDLDTLISECGVRVNGCTANDLLRVGRAHGLEDFGAWSENPEDVLKQDRPAILWWTYGHFVVYAGLNDDGEPVLCNPSRGRYAIDRGTFAVKCAGQTPGTVVALCVGRPEDMILRAANNHAAGDLFELGGGICVALRPITRGETLKLGWNYNKTTVADALNAQKEG